MSALLLAFMLSAPFAASETGAAAQEDSDSILNWVERQHEQLRVSLRFALLKFRLWQMAREREALDREFESLMAMPLDERVVALKARYYAETPDYLKVNGVLYEEIADYAGPGRRRFEAGDSNPIQRTAKALR